MAGEEHMDDEQSGTASAGGSHGTTSTGQPPPAPRTNGSQRKGMPMAVSLKDKISKACKGKIRLTLKQKTEIAAAHHHADPHQRKTCRQLAEQYGISERSVRLVSAAKYQEKIAMYKTGGCSTDEARIVRADPNPQLTEKLIKWIDMTRQTLNPTSAAQSTITTTLLQEKAVEFATELGLKDFKATKGWVYRWRQRFQKRKEICEQSEMMEKEYVSMVMARLDSVTRDLLSHSRMLPDSVHLAAKLKNAFMRETKNALAISQARGAASQPSQQPPAQQPLAMASQPLPSNSVHQHQGAPVALAPDLFPAAPAMQDHASSTFRPLHDQTTPFRW